MQRIYTDVVQTPTGDVLASASVFVYQTGTFVAATVYSDNGITPVNLPLTTDGNGQFTAYAANGRYDIRVIKAGYADTWYRDVLLEDPTQGNNAGQDSSGALVTATGTTTARTLANRFADTLNVIDFGAKGDGITNDTTAVDAALTAASANRKILYFPPGTYLYTGSGHSFPGTFLYIMGDGENASIILLGSSSRLIDTATVKDVVRISGLTFYQGLGAYRSTYTGTDVSHDRTFENNIFTLYTVCAIDLNAQDSPYVKISGNTFQAANSTGTIGVALNRWADSSEISNNHFLTNKIHIKCRAAGRNVSIVKNDLIQFEAGSGGLRAAIWFVTNSTPSIVNEGAGASVIDNKFGDEGLLGTDYRILYAPEASGTFNGDKMPDVSAATTEFIRGALISHNGIFGNDNFVNRGFIYSTTPFINGMRVFYNQFNGTPPKWFTEYKSVTTVQDWAAASNLYSNNAFVDGGVTYAPTKMSNGNNVGNLVDLSYFISGNSSNAINHTGGANDAGDLIQLYTSRGSAIPVISGSSLGVINDSTGDANSAASMSLNATGNVNCPITTASIVLGRQAWIEFDLRVSGGTPASFLMAGMIESGSYHFQRWIEVPATWARFRFPFFFRTNNAQSFILLNSTGSTVTFDVGRIRVYHAREPLAWGRFTVEQVNASALPTSSAGLAAGSLWVDGAAGNVLKRA